MPEEYNLTRTEIEELHARLARMLAVIARAALEIIFCTAGVSTFVSRWLLAR
jgi:hypothetical protein